MKHKFSRSVAVISCALGLTLVAADAATRPHKGGTLRVLMAAQPKSFDPRSLPAEPRKQAAAEKMLRLMFDRLVTLDEKGQPQPQLATGWQHDAGFKRWTFEIRPGVSFWDGTPLTAEIVAAALQSVPGTPPAKASGGSVVMEGPSASPEMLRDLATERFSIYRVGENGAILGTGPFYLSEWQPGKRAVLGANERDWRGRPHLDAIEIEMGVAPREQIVALELGKADVIEVGPTDARRVAQGAHRVWSSLPNELLAIIFQPARPTAGDAHVREALARSIDRGTMHTVLLQKQGEPAGGLLPQWLSGYAFLFPTAPDLPRAKEIVNDLPAERRSLTLGYDANDSIAEAIAQRIAVNAHDAGITVQAAEQPPTIGPLAAPASVDAGLWRLRIEGPDAGGALVAIVTASLVLDWKHPAGQVPAEVLYGEERNVLEGYQIIPLFHLPQTYGLSGRVRNWNAAPTGDLRLEEIWLEPEKP
jgi:ABC-type transport system substrate-binding protein